MKYIFLVLVMTIAAAGCARGKRTIGNNSGNNSPAGKTGPADSAQGKTAILEVNGDKIRLRNADGTEKEISANQVDYALVGPLIIDAYCVKCHQGANAPMGAQLDGYTNASGRASRILDRIKPGGGMPPSGQTATLAEVKVIEFWIDNKTPDKLNP